MSYNFKEIGNDVKIHQPVVIISPEKIVLKNKIVISEFAFLAAGQGTYIGNFIHLANHTSIIGGGLCLMEDFVGVYAGARIISGSDDISGKGIPSPTVSLDYRSYYRSFVYCKKHSFIGTNAIIHPGITIGEGAVVGSGSVVTKDLEPWGIYMGSPAKRVKDRPKETLLEMEKKVYAETNIQPSDFSEIFETFRNSKG